MTNEEYNKWILLYFDMQSINLQFNCNDIASLKAQRDKIKQSCIDCLTGVKHQADSFLFDTNACIFSTSETRELLFSHEEYLILEADTTKVVDGKYPLDYANEIVESNLDTIIDYIVQSGTETYNDRTSRGFGNRWSPYNEEERKQVIKLFNSGTWYDTFGAEGCIINSMEDVLNVLKNLRKYKGVNWSQLLEVGIDNADDLYWWYVTFSIDTTAI